MARHNTIIIQSTLWLRLLSMLTIAAAVLLPLIGAAADSPMAQHGVIDLRAYNFAQQAPMALRGDWGFYWNQLIAPNELTKDAGQAPSYYAFPAVWRHGKSGETNLAEFGKATYHLQVLLPAGVKQVGIQLPYFYGWAALYLDGEKVRDLGRYDPKELVTDSAGSLTVLLHQTKGDTLDVVIQTANYTATYGGVWRDMYIGDADMMTRRQAFRVGFDMFIISTLLFTSFYHAWMFVFRRKDDSNLWFGLFSLLIAIRTLFVGEGQVSTTFLDLPGLFSWRMELLTYYLAIPVLAKFISSVFPQDCKKSPLILSLLVIIPASFLAMFTNPPIFAHGLWITQAVNFYLVFEYGRAIVKAIRAKRDDAILFMAGFLVIAGLSVVEIIAVNLGLDIPRLSPIGMYLFIGFQSVVLARRFNAAFLAVESSERDIRKLNKELQDQEATRIELAKVSAERRMLQLSLAEAQNVYRSLGHGVDGIPGIEISSDYQAAEVSGGDWMGVNFDEIENRLYVVLADVTGHDLLSALVSIATAGGFKGAISALKASRGRVEMSFVLRVLADVLNSAVLDSGDQGQRLMTAALLAIDIQTGQVAYLNAGHTPLLHISGDRLAPVIPVASPLGLHNELRHGCVEFQLRQGDALFLHTDGLFDNVGGKGERLKLREIRPMLVNAVSAQQVLNQLRALTRLKWGQAKLKDDFSFVYLKWTGAASAQVDSSA